MGTEGGGAACLGVSSLVSVPPLTYCSSCMASGSCSALGLRWARVVAIWLRLQRSSAETFGLRPSQAYALGAVIASSWPFDHRRVAARLLLL